MLEIPPPALDAHVVLLLNSYRHWTGRELVDANLPDEERTRIVWNAPFVIASHDTQIDPVFNYGNRAALALFEATWEAFTAMPSRLSADPEYRDQRLKLLDRVMTQGFVDDYSGVRISAAGRRFRMRHATIWNVVDASGALHGQAVTFAAWEGVSPG